MVNFRVRDLDKMAAQLQAAGIAVKIDPQSYPNGRFARLHDPEGNPIELWQPKAQTLKARWQSSSGTVSEFSLTNDLTGSMSVNRHSQAISLQNRLLMSVQAMFQQLHRNALMGPWPD